MAVDHMDPRDEEAEGTHSNEDPQREGNGHSHHGMGNPGEAGSSPWAVEYDQ